MLSMILSHANSNEISLAGLQHITIFQLRVRTRLVAVDTDAALVDQAPGIAPALGKTRLDDRGHEVLRALGGQLVDLVGKLTLAESRVEVSFRSFSCLFSMQALGQLLRKRGFGVPRFERQHAVQLGSAQTRD